VRLRTWTQTFLLAVTPSLCVLTASDLAFAQQPAVAEPSEKDVQAAQLHFKKGSDYFTIKKYALALESFRKSYASVASPNSRLYIARSLVALGDLADAYFEFEAVIAEATARSVNEPKYAPTRDTAVVERDELSSKLALATFNVTGASPDSKLLLGGKEVPRDRWGKPYPIPPGSVEVVLETPSKPPVKESLTLAAGDKREVPLNAAPASTGPSGDGSLSGNGDTGTPPGDTSSGGGSKKLRPFAYVAGAVGVAGMATFAVAGILSNSTYSDLEETCRGPCPPERADDVSKGKTQQTIANVGLVVGIVGVAAAVPLFIFSVDKKSDDAPKSDASLVIGPSYMGVRGRF
jgi:hypothetical protein